MVKNRFNVILDQAFGSSGKGKMSTYLADRFNVRHVSSSNMPNAGHTAVVDGHEFVAKALPTAAILNKKRPISCYLSPGSGFDPERLQAEIIECGHPRVFVHERALVVTKEHAARERAGRESTAHLASTMQGCGAALSDKVLRREDCLLAGQLEWHDLRVEIKSAKDFREITRPEGLWLHECSQGYALSIDHGPTWPYVTSRNCTVQAALDQMAVPPHNLGDVYLNLRTFPIRVGNIVEGQSGPFYPDQQETTWEQIASEAGMPTDVAERLPARERTTVTKRIRRVATFSWSALKEAAYVNGATKLCVNFIQYLNWNDRNATRLEDLSYRSRQFIERCEDVTSLPVVLIGTGPKHEDIIENFR